MAKVEWLASQELEFSKFLHQGDNDWRGIIGLPEEEARVVSAFSKPESYKLESTCPQCPLAVKNNWKVWGVSEFVNGK